MPLKRATDSAARAGGAIERFIERTLAPRLEELAGQVRGLRGELGQFDKRMSENNSSLRSEIVSLRNEMQAEIRALHTRVESVAAQVNTRIDSLSTEINTRIDSLSTQVNTRIDALTQRLDDALNVRERLVALEAKLASRNG